MSSMAGACGLEGTLCVNGVAWLHSASSSMLWRAVLLLILFLRKYLDESSVEKRRAVKSFAIMRLVVTSISYLC